MTYIVKNSVSKYIVTTHDIKTVFELYKYHTYMWFHMNCNVLVLWKGIGIYCSIVSSRICRRDWSAETGLSLLSTMAPTWLQIGKIFGDFNSVHLFTSFFPYTLHSSIAYSSTVHTILIYNAELNDTDIQRRNEWHDTDSNHRSTERQAHTIATRPQLGTTLGITISHHACALRI